MGLFLHSDGDAMRNDCALYWENILSFAYACGIFTNYGEDEIEIVAGIFSWRFSNSGRFNLLLI